MHSNAIPYNRPLYTAISNPPKKAYGSLFPQQMQNKVLLALKRLPIPNIDKYTTNQPVGLGHPQHLPHMLSTLPHRGRRHIDCRLHAAVGRRG